MYIHMYEHISKHEFEIRKKKFYKFQENVKWKVYYLFNWQIFVTIFFF